MICSSDFISNFFDLISSNDLLSEKSNTLRVSTFVSIASRYSVSVKLSNLNSFNVALLKLETSILNYGVYYSSRLV